MCSPRVQEAGSHPSVKARASVHDLYSAIFLERRLRNHRKRLTRTTHVKAGFALGLFLRFRRPGESGELAPRNSRICRWYKRGFRNRYWRECEREFGGRVAD